MHLKIVHRNVTNLVVKPIWVESLSGESIPISKARKKSFKRSACFCPKFCPSYGRWHPTSQSLLPRPRARRWRSTRSLGPVRSHLNLKSKINVSRLKPPRPRIKPTFNTAIDRTHKSSDNKRGARKNQEHKWKMKNQCVHRHRQPGIRPRRRAPRSKLLLAFLPLHVQSVSQISGHLAYESTTVSL